MGGRFAWPLLAVALSPVFALTGATAAPPPQHQPSSLIVAGSWLDVNVIGQPACPETIPEGGECLSLNVVADVRLDNVRTLAGPTVPWRLTARFEFHAEPADGYYQVLLVRPSAVDRRRFDALSIGRMRRNRQLCISRHWLADNGVQLPAHARIAGDSVCLRSYFAGR